MSAIERGPREQAFLSNAARVVAAEHRTVEHGEHARLVGLLSAIGAELAALNDTLVAARFHAAMTQDETRQAITGMAKEVAAITPELERVVAAVNAITFDERGRPK